ncbi:RNA polymerase-binding protein DksA [Neisseria gonorrhoeae]
MVKLTEQDILNWIGPEDDYMNDDHLAFFRELLVKMQDELIENASVTTGHLQEHESAPDPTDRATQEEEYALELRTRDRERKLLSKIQATIRNIDEGDYGFCADTGEPIGLKRLLARPTATLSVEAQERRERMKKQFAD